VSDTDVGLLLALFRDDCFGKQEFAIIGRPRSLSACWSAAYPREGVSGRELADASCLGTEAQEALAGIKALGGSKPLVASRRWYSRIRSSTRALGGEAWELTLGVCLESAL